MQERFKVNVRRSCRLALLQPSVWYAKSEARDQSALRLRIREIAMDRPRFGCLRVLVMLQREGWAVGKKRVYRPYRLEGLQLRMKVKRRKRISLQRGRPTPATGSNQHWSMDLVHDQMFDGRAFRVFTVIDQWSAILRCMSLNAWHVPTFAQLDAISGAAIHRRLWALDEIQVEGICGLLRTLRRCLKRCIGRAAVAVGGFAASGAALAHEASGSAGGFLSGFVHPLAGPDHLVAMVAVGLWGAFLGRPALWLLPVVFPLVMAAGGAAGVLGMPLPGVEVGIALSAIALGAAVAWGWQAPLVLAAVLVAVFAVFHGHAHGTELPQAADPIAYSLGFVVSTGLLHLSGIALGELTRWPWGGKAVKGLGALIALVGAVFLVRAL